jgi:hypothetical protein
MVQSASGTRSSKGLPVPSRHRSKLARTSALFSEAVVLVDMFDFSELDAVESPAVAWPNTKLPARLEVIAMKRLRDRFAALLASSAISIAELD